MAIVLGIESTCDETAAAVVVDGVDVRSNVIASQVDLHAKYRGVVPEIASRAHIENILPVVREAVSNAACAFADIDAIAVAHRPGLIGSLLVGVTAAKTLAWALGKPLIGVDHVQAHLYSVKLEEEGKREEARGKSVEMPAVGLVVSGGHSSLYRIRSWTDLEKLGGTLDDAVGEAYDKVAAILGLGYPGGPLVDRLARHGDPDAVKFPRTFLGRESLDFSFSGLKTAVLYHVRGVPGKPPREAKLTEQEVQDVAAGFQAACVDVLIKKLERALKKTGARSIVIGGGVSANSALREGAKKFSVPVYFPAMAYTTDNAAMIAGLGDVMLREGRVAGLELDAVTHRAIS